MTDKPLESDQASGSAGASQTPDPSTGEGASPSGQAAQLQGTLESLADTVKRLQGEVRALQSGKDKGINAVREDVKGIREYLDRYDKLRAKGMGADEAIAEIEQGSSFERRIQVLNEQVSRLLARTEGGNPGDGASAAAKVFSSKGLDLADPDVVAELIGVSGKDPQEIELAAFRLKERKAGQPNPTKAQSPAMTSGDAPDPNLASLRKQYETEVVKLRGNAAAIANLKAEYRRKGLADLW